MIITDSKEQINEYLRLALQYMGKYSIPATPVNYAIWYEYASGRNNDLRNEVDKCLGNCKPFSKELSEYLYKKHIAGPDVIQNEKILKEIQTILIELTRHVSTTGGTMSEFGGRLFEQTKMLTEASDVSLIKKAVKEILTETKGMLNSGESLKQKLQSTSRELELLKKELEKTKQKATTDALTGIANREAFEKRLKEETEEAAGSGRPLCMLFADIDFFKRFNDQYGHLVGDMVLRITAAMIKGFIRGNDMVARYGGEEFVMLLPNTDLNGAKFVAETIRSFFENKKWKAKDTGASIGSITLSFGVSLYRPGEALDAFIKRADDALYKSKSDGRNRVTCEE